MHNQDWSLVFFTTLSQLSVGIILCFSFINYTSSDAGFIVEKGLSLKNPALLSLIFIGVATIISFLHLGNPANAYNSMNNIAGSWVSREILGLSMFSLSLLIVFFLGWKFEYDELFKYLLMLSALIGLFFIWFMIRIYIIPTIPSWSTWNTPVTFTSTAFVLGITAFLILSFNGFIKIESQTEKLLINTLLIVLFIEICVGIFHQYRLEGMDTGIDELVFNQGTFYKVFLLRMGLLIIGFMAMFFIALKPNLFLGNSYYVWMYLLLVLVIVQEFIGRLLFYSSYFRIGV